MPSSNQGQQARHGLRATQGQQDYYPELQSRPMMAMVYDDYGPPDVLHRTSLPIPDRLPGEVLIQVAASSINPIDCRLRAGELKGLLPGGFPRVPGYDVAALLWTPAMMGRLRSAIGCWRFSITHAEGPVRSLR